LGNNNEQADNSEPATPKGEVLVYQAEDGQIKVDVWLEDETVWLSQQLMAELFQTTQQNISLHIRNVIDEGELAQEATHKKCLSVRREGNRDVRRELDYYNLDMIISVGYRVKSAVATRFRIWAAHDHTAAEIIYVRADASQANMGITNYTGNKLLKRDVEIAKNYLNEDELNVLNRIVTTYLEVAELQALNRIPMTMRDWIDRLHQFLTMTGRELLDHAGKVSHEAAFQKAHAEYETFRVQQLEEPTEVEKHFMAVEKEMNQIKSTNKGEG